jgi:hypothetical protein
MPPDLLAVTVVKALAELAALFLLGHGAIWVLAGRKRDQNLVYQIFQALTRPVLRATRYVTPRAIIDRHIPFVALMLLFWIWIATVLTLSHLCSAGGHDCRSMRQAGPTSTLLIIDISNLA